jgi:hypothetical protein
MTARRQGNVVADIKRAVNPDDYDLLTAEGRADNVNYRARHG